MKNVLLVLIILLSITTLNAQVELKGYTIGQKYSGDEAVYTTLGGVTGIITLMTIDDARIYQMSFLPSNDGETVCRVTSSDVDVLVAGLESKFDITLVRQDADSYSDDYYLIGQVDGCDIFISVEYNEFMDYPYSIGILITSKELEKIAAVEIQSRANKDF